MVLEQRLGPVRPPFEMPVQNGLAHALCVQFEDRAGFRQPRKRKPTSFAPKLDT